MNEEPWYSKNDIWISFAITISIAAMFGGMIEYTTSAIKIVWSISKFINTILVASLSFILSEIIIGFIKSVYILRNTLRDDLYKIMHNYPQKLLAKEKVNEKSIENVFEELVKIRDKRGLAFDFAIDSFQKILDKGFVIFEDDVSKYIDFLVKGINFSTKYIFATCVVRPFWFLVNPILDETGKTTKIGYEKRARHLNPLLNEATKAKKVRIEILDIDEIILIINDTLKNLTISSSPKPAKPKFHDIPEIDWFVREANKSPGKINLFWAIKPDSGLLKEIEDIIIYDGDIALQFKFVNETEGWGHTILSWKSVIKPKIIQNVELFMSTIENGKEGNINGFDQIIFRSFIDLLAYIPNLTTERKSKVLNNISDDIKNKLEISNDISIVDIYKKILKKLNDGYVIFPLKVDLAFYNLEGEPSLKRVCEWKNNWNRLKEKG